MAPRKFALLLVLVTLAAAPAGGMPPPEQVCGACGAAFEDAAAENGVSLSVERSTATVTVHESGAATWTVRNEVGTDAASRLRANDTLTRVIADVVDADDIVTVDVSDAGTVTIRYRVEDFAEPSVGGAMRVDYFREDFAVANYDSLGADRLTVVAPEGTRVGRALPSASVEGREMTLTTYEPGVDSAFVTFVPQGSLLAPLLSLLAVAEVLVGVVARTFVREVVPPLAVFGLGIAVDVVVLSRVRYGVESARRYAAPALAGLGGLSILVATVLPVVGRTSPPLFGAGVGLVALGAVLSREESPVAATYRTLVLASLGALAVAVVTAAGSAALFGGSSRVSFLLFALAPVFGLIPAGAALGRGDRGLAVATALVAFLVGVLAFVPLARRPMGVIGVFPILGGTYAVGLVLAGWPLLVVGAALTADSSTEENEDR